MFGLMKTQVMNIRMSIVAQPVFCNPAVMNAAETRSYCLRQGSSTSHCQHMNNFSLRLTLWHGSITGTLYLGKGALKRCTYKTTQAGLNKQCVLSQRPYLPLLSYSGRVLTSVEKKKNILLQWTLNLQPHSASLHALQP